MKGKFHSGFLWLILNNILNPLGNSDRWQFLFSPYISIQQRDSRYLIIYVHYNCSYQRELNIRTYVEASRITRTKDSSSKLKTQLLVLEIFETKSRLKCVRLNSRKKVLRWRELNEQLIKTCHFHRQFVRIGSHANIAWKIINRA